ncbi:hypothetical protein [Nitriliruptor alkaliphilus]|uniref:DODA-type extradiol aromatic ring-opening family dioxygenase n=1 Tax=Nitriliruptor alkaliphilus TaxID=427918 RepID=UPI0006985A48|nr:hypothetical protein [Nitriliruptor alkaliphilus]
MGRVVGVFATSHSPGITGFPEKADPAKRAAVDAAYGQVRDRIAELEPDAIVGVSVEHFTNFFMDNLPVFSIATAEDFEAPVTDEMGEFLRVERRRHAGHPALAEHVRAHALAEEFDPSLVGGDFAWDENFCVPLKHLDPEHRYPVVPIIVNAVEPPMPTLNRCYEFGRMLRRAIEAQDVASRVVVLGTGGLSHWVGLPEAGNINEAFDRRFLDHLSAGDIGPILALTEEQIDAAGNGAHEIRSWLVAAGTAEGRGFDVLAYEPVPEWLTGTAVAAAR